MAKDSENQDDKQARLIRQHAAVVAAISLFPTLKSFADAVGLENWQTAQKWRDDPGVQVPICWCAHIERVTRRQVRRRQLREDWDYEVNGKRR